MGLKIRKFVDYSEEIHIEGFKEANNPLHIFAVANNFVRFMYSGIIHLFIFTDKISL